MIYIYKQGFSSFVKAKRIINIRIAYVRAGKDAGWQAAATSGYWDYRKPGLLKFLFLKEYI